MLRLLVLVLLVANLGMYAWHEGALDTIVGVPAGPLREPDRLGRQIHPERLILVGTPAADDASAVGSGSESAPSPSSISNTSMVTAGAKCVEAGPFTADEYRPLSVALSKTLKPGSWTTQTVAVQGLWLVYMGPYPEPDMFQRKQSELRRIRGLSFEEVRSPPSLAMGLSLGRFNDAAAANASLETMRQRGIRTARVVTLRPAMDLTVVRIAQGNTELQAQLPGLFLPAGKGFLTCASQ